MVHMTFDNFIHLEDIDREELNLLYSVANADDNTFILITKFFIDDMSGNEIFAISDGNGNIFGSSRFEYVLISNELLIVKFIIF